MIWAGFGQFSVDEFLVIYAGLKVNIAQIELFNSPHDFYKNDFGSSGGSTAK